MAEPLSNDEIAKLVAKTITDFRKILAPVNAAVLVYRAELIAAGWSTSAAEQMAAQYFNLFMAAFTQGRKA